MKRLSSIFIIVFLLYACGAGDSGIPSGGSGCSGGGSASISITSFDVNPRTITNGTIFDVTWSVNYSAPSNPGLSFI